MELLFKFLSNLWKLFEIHLVQGVYGDVHRVKILFNKKDTALIQFNDAAQAQTCTLYVLGFQNFFFSISPFFFFLF